MSDSLSVAESERRDELLEVATRLRFLEAARISNLGVNLSAGSELHDEIDLCFSGHDLVDCEDVRMVLEAAHGFDLPDYHRFHTGRCGSLLVDDFDGHKLFGFDGTSHMDFGKATAAEKATEFVFAEENRRGGFIW